MAGPRIGVLGGTFNPVHLGHLLIAEEFRERLALDRVLFVPAAAPPHKGDRRLADPLHRYAMVALAVADHPAFAVSDLEFRRPGPSYSAVTLELLAGELSGSLLYFLMGSDTFLDLPAWRTPERLTTWATVAVAHRGGVSFDPASPAAAAVLARLGRPAWRRVPPEPWSAIPPGEVILVETVSLPVSAREVRRRVAEGRSVRFLVPPAVADYIAAHHLYADPER